MSEKTKELVVQEAKMELNIDINEATIKNLIYAIRGQQVMLDSDLAELYQVETKVFNQAVKRNMERFPKEFCFQLTREEYNSLRSQIVTSKGKGGRRYLPYVFTEQGIAMLSAVLRSDVRTSTLTATAGACLSLEEASLRRSWSEKVRARSRKRSGHENCSWPDL